MRERVITAAVLVPVVVVVFLLGDPWLTFGIAVLAFLAASEAFALLRAAGVPASPGIGVIAAPVAVLGTLLHDGPVGLVYVFIAAVIILSAMAAFRHQDVRAGFMDWMGSTYGALYVSLLAFVPLVMGVAPAIPASAPLYGVTDAGRVWLLVLLLTVWGFDTFAYLSGRTFKRGHFLNHISPNKTWSGVIGGTVAAMVISALLSWAAGQSPIVGVALGFIIAVCAQSGDVAESLLKRAAGAKDSGMLLPGHGGVLDRIDSFLFAGPAMFLALTWAAWFGLT